MRRLLLFVLPLLAVTACYQAEVSDVVAEQYSLKSLSATIDNDLTRTYAQDGADGSIQMYWHKDDRIAVTDMVSLAAYSLVQGEGSVDGQFEVEASYADETFVQGSTLYGVSPYKAVKFVTGKNRVYPSKLTEEKLSWDDASTRSAALDNDLNVVIPSVQQFTGLVGENDVDRNIMIGTTADGGQTFTFAPVASIARFDIDLGTDETIHSVELVAQGDNVAGAAQVDLGTLTIGVATTASVKLCYANPYAGARNDGWALIAPVNWSDSAGSVFYRVATDRGVYTFCKRPTKPFEAGCVYTFPLQVDKFTRVENLKALEDGCYHFDPCDVAVAAVRVTDSTISIGWTITASNIPYIGQIVPNRSADYAKDFIKKYKVALYKDVMCSDLVVSVDNIRNTSSNTLYSGLMTPPRFVFPGLEPQTTYYAKVWNMTDNTESALLQITTAPSVANRADVVTQNAKSGDLVLFENFDTFIYGGELSSRSAGVHRASISSMQTIVGADVKGEITADKNGYQLKSASGEAGLFSTLSGLVDDFGLEDWGWIGGSDTATGSSVCARPGFLKIGTNNNSSSVCLPIFRAIAEGQAATLSVTFKAAPYGSPTEASLGNEDRTIAVKALTDVSIDNNYKVSYYSVADYHSFTLDSNDISDWKEYTVELKNVPYGGAVAIGGALATAVSNRLLLDDIVVRVVDVYPYQAVQPTVKGVVTYSDGTPAAGVSVSDGFSVVQTGKDGSYTIANPHQDAWYIYYSVPADCAVQTNDYGQPLFYTKYERGRTEYNFTLTKLPSGKENKFSLFCFADPQCKNGDQRERFKAESMPEVKSYSASKGVPSYGVTLGDIVSSGATSDTTPNLPYMRDHMHKDAAGMPIFQTMGNHDFLYFNSSAPIAADESSSTYNIKAQRLFENLFGPINHSWNRGDAHIVCMRDMLWNSNTDPGDYSLGFSDEQYQWLKQDLSFVPKDKLVILCVHIPLVNSTKKNIQNVISLLAQYDEAHIMAGHTHYMRNEPTLSKGVYEHVHAAICGAWWASNVNGDGCPNGYGVYDIEGNTIKNWYYKGVNNVMKERDYQIRLYRGDLLCGGSRWKYQWQFGSNVLLANVFNADSNWTIKVYEDGVFSGKMTLISYKKYQHDTQGIDLTTNPVLVPTNSSQDWWAIGYHLGVVGRSRTSQTYYTSCFHVYKYTLKNASAKVRVEATDIFGRTYVQDEITTDYTLMNTK